MDGSPAHAYRAAKRVDDWSDHGAKLRVPGRVCQGYARIVALKPTPEEFVIVLRVLAAMVVGASIGFERTFHGRPAGFRTHALVCLASSLPCCPRSIRTHG